MSYIYIYMTLVACWDLGFECHIYIKYIYDIYMTNVIYIYDISSLLRSWVRIPLGAWIFVCCECRVLSGRGLCDELITRPEESYRVWCVVVCDLETSRMGAPYIYGISHLRVKWLRPQCGNSGSTWAVANTSGTGTFHDAAGRERAGLLALREHLKKNYKNLMDWIDQLWHFTFN